MASQIDRRIPPTSTDAEHSFKTIRSGFEPGFGSIKFATHPLDIMPRLGISPRPGLQPNHVTRTSETRTCAPASNDDEAWESAWIEWFRNRAGANE